MGHVSTSTDTDLQILLYPSFGCKRRAPNKKAIIHRDHMTLFGESMRSVFRSGHFRAAPAHPSQQGNGVIIGVTHDLHIIANFFRWKSHHCRVVLRTGGIFFTRTQGTFVCSWFSSLFFPPSLVWSVELYCLWGKDYILYSIPSSFSDTHFWLGL